MQLPYPGITKEPIRPAVCSSDIFYETFDRIGRGRTLPEPVFDAILLEGHRNRILERVIGSDRLQIFTVTGTFRIGHNNSVKRGLLGTVPG
jgi:hypothetical protein